MSFIKREIEIKQNLKINDMNSKNAAIELINNAIEIYKTNSCYYANNLEAIIYLTN